MSEQPMPAPLDFARFRAWQVDFRTVFEDRLARQLAHMLADAPPRLAQAIRHAVQNGGKRLRPMLVILGFGVDGNQPPLPDPQHPRLESVWAAAIAIELIHGYSLIHDDLPSMDNDDWRRGKPTVHRAFDEATAVLAGDALQSLAFSLLAGAEAMPDAMRLTWIQQLSNGANRMVYGQQLDLNPPEQSPTPAELSRMHGLKTGALLRAALMMGAIGSPEASQAALEAFIRPLGLAFQIQDDILDATGTAAQLGKTPGKDAADQKYSYVTVLGLDAARSHLQATINEALAALEPLGARADALRACADFVLTRDH